MKRGMHGVAMTPSKHRIRLRRLLGNELGRNITKGKYEAMSNPLPILGPGVYILHLRILEPLENGKKGLTLVELSRMHTPDLVKGHRRMVRPKVR